LRHNKKTKYLKGVKILLTAEVSLYPLKTTNSSQIINNSLEALRQFDLQAKVGSLSTRLQGNEEDVWSGLKNLFDQAKNQGEVSMVVNLSNSAV